MLTVVTSVKPDRISLRARSNRHGVRRVSRKRSSRRRDFKQLGRPTVRVAVARQTESGARVRVVRLAVESVAALVAVRSGRILAAVDAVAAVSRRLVERGVEIAFLRQTAAVARCTQTQTHGGGFSQRNNHCSTSIFSALSAAIHISGSFL